jgi:hypothetical protein
MSELTLEKVRDEHARLGKMIEQLTLSAATATLSFPAVEIALQPGERYAGPVLNDDGTAKHHLVLLAARPEDDLNWTAAKAWAEKAGGTLPDRQEQALLFANCKAALPQRWCWSSEAEGSSCAWHCDFTHGTQYYTSTSYEGCAVAVRRLNP